MSKYTSGDWHACNDGKCSCKMIWSKSTDQHVATAKRFIACVHREWGDDPNMIYGDISEEEQIANARLIATAPALVETLRELLDAEWMVTHDWGGDRDSVFDKALAVLNSIEGKDETNS